MRALAVVVTLVLSTSCVRDDTRQALAAGTANVSSAAQQLVTRRVWAGDRSIDPLGDPSPDGRLLSFTNWETGDLAIRDLAADSSRLLTRKNGWETSDFAEFSAFSRDGKHIAYAWYNDTLKAYQLRVVDTAANSRRVLFSNPKRAVWVEPYDFLPDGRHVIASLGGIHAHRKPQDVLLALVSMTGEVRPLKRGVYPQEANASPDGKWIAYDVPVGRRSTAPHDVHVIGIDGGDQRSIMAGPSNDRLLGWLESPDALLILSNRSGVSALWLQYMDGGRPMGEAELLRADLGFVEHIGVSGNRWFYFQVLEPQQVAVGTIDIDNARVVVEPEAVSPSGTRANSPTWSPDGRYLAYLVRTHGITERGGILVIQREDGTQLREMPMPIDNVTNLRWTADPNTLVANGRDSSGALGVFTIDLKSGTASLLRESGSQENIRRPRLSADGRTLYYFRGHLQRHGVFAYDLATGRERMLYEASSIAHIELSPDDSQIAITTADPPSGGNRLLVIPSTGGSPREVVRVPKGYFFPGYSGVAWSADSRNLLYVRASTRFTSERQALFVVGLGGSEPRKLLENPRFDRLMLHPDGRRIAFARGNNRGEVWVMEGFANTRRQ